MSRAFHSVRLGSSGHDVKMGILPNACFNINDLPLARLAWLRPTGKLPWEVTPLTTLPRSDPATTTPVRILEGGDGTSGQRIAGFRGPGSPSNDLLFWAVPHHDLPLQVINPQPASKTNGV